MKLRLSKETVRKLAVKSALRTGAAYPPVDGGAKPKPISGTDCQKWIGEGGYGSGAIGGCYPSPGGYGGDPAPIVGVGGIIGH